MTDIANALFPTEGGAPNRQSEGDAGARPNLNTDRAAATMFPSDAGRTDGPARPAAGEPPALFKDAPEFDARPVEAFMSGFAQSAIADGDLGRADALAAAGEALVADFKAAGTDGYFVSDALDIVRERQGDTLAGPVPVERLEADMASALETLATEGISDAELNAARALISDLDRVAPGTVESLIATGAGNDLRLVRMAVAEAKRRGYLK